MKITLGKDDVFEIDLNALEAAEFLGAFFGSRDTSPSKTVNRPRRKATVKKTIHRRNCLNCGRTFQKERKTCGTVCHRQWMSKKMAGNTVKKDSLNASGTSNPQYSGVYAPTHHG